MKGKKYQKIFKILKLSKRDRKILQKLQTSHDEEQSCETSQKTPKMDYFWDKISVSNLDCNTEGRLVGFYTQKERKNKISHYRAKATKRKIICPVVKEFIGRSISAFRKPRKWGKFVKSEIAHLYALTPRQRMERTQQIDNYLNKKDYNNALTYLIEY